MKQASPFDGLNAKKRRQLSQPRREEENAALRKIIGERFESARKINLWTQAEAAEKIGYANSTQLSLVEDGKRPTPLVILLRASVVFGVSVDYLVGVSDEPERDPKAAERQATLRHVESVVTGLSTLVATQVQRYMTAGAPSVLSSRTLIKHGEDLVEAVTKMQSLNADAFDGELRGAATVLRTADTLQGSLCQAKEILNRHERVAMEVVNTAARRLGVTHPLIDPLEARLL